jgi:hypothetical protein
MPCSAEKFRNIIYLLCIKLAKDYSLNLLHFPSITLFLCLILLVKQTYSEIFENSEPVAWISLEHCVLNYTMCVALCPIDSVSVKSSRQRSCQR